MIFILSVHTLGAQSPVAGLYSALTIPDSLKKDANAVYRLDEGVLEITSPSQYKLKIRQVITILNDAGAHHLRHTFGFDKFNKVDDVEIKIFNSKGGEVKRSRKKDFQVQAAYDGISLVTDNKIMHLASTAPGYPCTVEINVVLMSSGYTELPDWFLNTSEESTELFRYVVKVPSALDIRHRTKNMSLKPMVQAIGSDKVYTWEVRNVPARKIDTDGYAAGNYMPGVEVAPNVFEYDGHKGEFRDWKSVGSFFHSLFEESNPFTEKRREEIRSLVQSSRSDQEKIAVLYSHLKRNMRYVSIQLGIGGFKPFPVQFVDEKKYGDCKALTNYMRYMLHTVGIKSYPALINTGYNAVPADPSFPADPFNHVILCVPLQKDSVWLECTSNSNETGFLGSFTENKNALLLTEKGGVLVRTPKSNPGNNHLYTRTDIFLEDDGSALADSRIYCTGDERDIFNYMRQVDADRKKELLVKNMNYRLPDAFELKFGGDTLTGSAFQLKAAYGVFYDFKAGSKLFFQQGIHRLCREDLKESKRTVEYLFDHPYERVDTTVYHLPKGMAVENLLPVKELNNENASYKVVMHYDAAQHRVEVISQLVLKSHIIKAEGYEKVVHFFKEVRRHEEQKVVFKKL